ncbi:diacylglycerol/lipid kinase family protein [Streptococcus uberis]|uniref:diacylglycerol/lipid kinase family protein n=1 Tax=Streptococcus uberis TaxID=1349 RepID=UPI001939FB9F|nr:diacylglycerol kinase family protein [Streptococcus uberis]
MKNAMLIVNPASGGEQAQEFERLAKEKLATYFEQVMVKHTQAEGDAKAFAREAARSHFHSLFVMGGDGTVNEGVSGIAEESYRPHFGFFPLGTVNDLARAVGIPLDPKEAIASMRFDRTILLDIGKINQSYFTNVVAIGDIPESINNVDDKLKTNFGPMAYVLSGLKEILNHKTYSFHLDYDGKSEAIESSLILIGLTNSIGGLDRFTPEAKVDDGYLHLLITKDKNFLETLATLPDLFSKENHSNDKIKYQQIKEITISLKEEQLQTNVDGDEGDKLPVKIGILPHHLQLYSI